jgi:hypothetical protein
MVETERDLPSLVLMIRGCHSTIMSVVHLYFIQPHLLAYAYAYKPKFESLTLNLKLIVGFFFIVVYFSAFAFRSLRTRILKFYLQIIFRLQICCFAYSVNKQNDGVHNVVMCMQFSISHWRYTHDIF